MSTRPSFIAENEQASEFKTLAENLPDGVARLDHHLCYLYVNPAVEQLFGIPALSFIGRTNAEIGLPVDVTKAYDAAVTACFATGAPQTFDFQMQSPPGSLSVSLPLKYFTVRVMPEWYEGVSAKKQNPKTAIASVLVISYDVTSRTLTEHERDALLVREKTARELAEMTAHARDQFLSIVSHELRTPLNGIQSWAHVLEHQLPPNVPGMQRALSGIRTGVQQQVQLIDNLLDASLVISGKLNLVKQTFTLEGPIHKAIEALQAQIAAKKLNLSTQLHLDDACMEGDRNRIQQVISHLLSNAIKFTPEDGSIEITATLLNDSEGHAKEMLAADQLRSARITVRDSGSGIAKDFLPHLFDPFRLADNSTTRRSGGIGLGLALVRRITELHGGRVTAVSYGENLGSTFSVYLPLASNDTDPTRSIVLPNESASEAASLDHLQVLVIDDQLEARESLAALLRQTGAHPIIAGSAREALAYLEQNGPENLPDVLICDIAMPEIDGYFAINKIRQWESSHNVPSNARMHAIALTAFAQPEDHRRALAGGFQMHLTKPLMLPELVRILSERVTH